MTKVIISKNFIFFALLFLLLIFIPISIKHSDYSKATNIITNKKGNNISEYYIFINVEKSTLYLYKNKNLIKTYECAGGKSETPSPIGTFYIDSKEKWGDGFGGRWLGLSCSWGTFGIHGTTIPESIGSKASHGCIRLRIDDIFELYDIVPINTVVKIVDGPYGPFGKGFRYIWPGMYGSDVLEIQKYLKKTGFYNGYCNGHTDAPGFYKALTTYQKKNGFDITGAILPDVIISMGFRLEDYKILNTE